MGRGSNLSALTRQLTPQAPERTAAQRTGVAPRGRIEEQVQKKEKAVRYYPQRARRKLDISLLLKVCPDCLGDLVFESDFSGEFYRCLQCKNRTEPRNRVGRLPTLPTPESRPRLIA